MPKKKVKGALELLMSTIIIIILGVTLLTLGLVFVRTIFSEVTQISEITFREARESLSILAETDEILSIPPEVGVKLGEALTFKITLGNDGSVPPGDKFTLDVEENPELKNAGVKITIVGPRTITVPEGQKNSYQILAEVNKDASLKPAGYIVTARYGGEIYQQSSFVVFPRKL